MQTVKTIDPRVGIRSQDEKLHAVLHGALRYQQKVLPSTSWGDPSSQPTTANFVYNSNSTKNIVDRYVRIRAYLRVECSEGPFLIGQHDALRQYPLASIMENVVAQINQESFSDRIADKVHALSCFVDRKEWSKSNSVAPNYPDQFQNYNDWQVLGSGKNPLSLYAESEEDHRGGFPIVLSNDGKSFTAVVTEPLFMSPFYSGYGDYPEGFSNINEINLTITWLSKIERVLSHSIGGNNLGNISVTFYQSPELLVTEMTPDLMQPRLLSQSIPYNKLQQFPLSQPVINPGQVTTMSSESFKLSQIPSHLWVFVRHKRQTSDASTSDSFCGIRSLRLTWNTETLFSSCSQQDLYEMSRRNGLSLSWSQFSKYRGSPLCLSFGDQIGLIDGESPGIRGQYTLSLEVDVENLSAFPFDGELYVVMNYQGSVTLSENNCSSKIGLLRPEDVLASSQSQVELSYDKYKDLHGGSFWSSLKNIIHKAGSAVSHISHVAGEVAPVLGLDPKYSDLAKKVGKVGEIVSKSAGGGYVGGALGGAITGGKLKNRMPGRYHPQSGLLL